MLKKLVPETALVQFDSSAVFEVSATRNLSGTRILSRIKLRSIQCKFLVRVF